MGEGRRTVFSIRQGGAEKWEFYRKLPESWTIGYGSLRFKIAPTGFKHTGLFPEQAVNWDLFSKLISKKTAPSRC